MTTDRMKERFVELRPMLIAFAVTIIGGVAIYYFTRNGAVSRINLKGFGSGTKYLSCKEAYLELVSDINPSKDTSIGGSGGGVAKPVRWCGSDGLCKDFDSHKSLGEAFNKHPSNISNVLAGRQKTFSGGSIEDLAAV